MSKVRKKSQKHSSKKNLKGWRRYWVEATSSIPKRIGLGLIALVILFTGVNYGLSCWYLNKHQDEPIVFGTTFIPSYAEFFKLDPKETMQAMIDELGIRNFRLVSYWREIEYEKGTYDFSQLDWQFEKAEAANAKVSLAIGVRQPRWPECHEPDWALNRPIKEWYPDLKLFMTAVVERYKDSPALESYQLENEFFMSVFGKCTDFSRDRLVDEFNMVKALDPHHPIIVSRSNNVWGLPLGEPRADMFAVSIYKRIWDKTITRRYFEYPLPAWFYGSLAGGGELMTGKNMMIHELQAEPWLPDTGEFAMNSVRSVEEQDKSLNAERLRSRLQYAKDTGIRRIDTWGAEWWYWRKTVANDPSLWDVAREEFQKTR